VRAILPIHFVLIDQFQIRFIDQIRRLQRMPAVFVFQIPARDASQFVIHHRNQLIERSLVAAAPIQQKLSDRL
jgi:hypothetical protein